MVALSAIQLWGASPFSSFNPVRDCSASVPRDGHVLADDPIDAVIGSSRSAFPCAEHVTVAGLSDSAGMRTGAQLAIREGGPLLLVDGAGVNDSVLAEIRRLEPGKVTMVGIDLQGATEVSSLGVDVDRVDVDSSALDPAATAEKEGPVFLLDSSMTTALPAIEVIANQTGGGVLVAEDVDLADLPDPMRLVIEGATALRLVGAFDPTSAWQVELVRSDTEVPGGGMTLFPGKRLVGFYGTPRTASLGVLGEQGPEETAARLIEQIEGYGSDGSVVIPTFELIATVASSAPGTDGDYSDEVSVDVLRPWVDYAADNGIYVVLDLQPGRANFLAQAQRYEELLRLPHVGLALDPEWRLAVDQVHLEQVGSVDSSEINAAAEWVAGIVREEVLPQKLFLVHQFQESMITNRDELVSPNELAVVIQMDGQGPLPTKRETFNVLTSGWSANTGYLWGWKNFYDEDLPMATAPQVLGLDPVPVFVSFQ